METKHIITIFLIAGLLLLLAGVVVPSLTPQQSIITCENVSANYIVESNQTCIGRGWWLWKSVECSIKVKNSDQQPAEFSAAFSCFTLENYNNPNTITSDTVALSPNQEYTFKINYGVGDKEWRCNLENISSSKVTKCTTTK